MGFHSTLGPVLVQSATASTRTTEARNLVGFNRELIVIRNLLALLDITLGIDDNLFLPVDSDNLGVAVGLKRGYTAK